MLFELAQGLVNKLLSKKLTLSLAESCTGGMASQWITEISGSSSVFLGGVIAYSNEIKQSLINVPPEMLAKHGAVSSEVAMAMAEGVRFTCKSDIGASITGIAGPSGGTADKPVGTVYIAVSTADKTTFRLLNLKGKRNEVRTQTTKQIILFLKELIDNM